MEKKPWKSFFRLFFYILIHQLIWHFYPNFARYLFNDSTVENFHKLVAVVKTRRNQFRFPRRCKRKSFFLLSNNLAFYQIIFKIMNILLLFFLKYNHVFRSKNRGREQVEKKVIITLLPWYKNHFKWKFCFQLGNKLCKQQVDLVQVLCILTGEWVVRMLLLVEIIFLVWKQAFLSFSVTNKKRRENTKNNKKNMSNKGSTSVHVLLLNNCWHPNVDLTSKWRVEHQLASLNTQHTGFRNVGQEFKKFK